MNWKLIGKYTMPTVILTLGAYFLINILNSYLGIETNSQKWIGLATTTTVFLFISIIFYNIILKQHTRTHRHNMLWAVFSCLLLLSVSTIWFVNPPNQSEIIENSEADKTDKSISQPLLTEGQTNTDDALVKPDPVIKAQISEAYGKLPLTFEANEGQVDSQVQYLSRGAGYNLFLTGTEAVIALHSPVKVDNSSPTVGDESEPASGEQSVLRMKLVGANAAPKTQGLEPQSGKSNYFLGNDPEKWRTNVNHYARVQYTDVYSGVDVVYYGNQRQLEYDFIVAPGTSPDIIKMSFEGAQDLSIDEDGDLILRTAGGDIRQHKPIIYQETNGERHEIAGRYEIKGDREIGFELAAYDTTKPLVIDPVINYSTYLGGYGRDQGYGIAVDSSGNAYVTGFTEASNFPTVNSLPYGDREGSGWSQDAFVTKLNSAGSALVYSTYLGGQNRSNDKALGIAVDSAGNAYVTGYTNSVDFPTVNPFQRAAGGGGDAFVTKINPAGSALVYSTYLGGSDANEESRSIAVDSAGNAYVTGTTRSTDFPTANPLQPAIIGSLIFGEAFVTKLNPAGSALVYSTYLGGGYFDDGNAIAVDSSGNAYVTGSTSSYDFPLANALQSTCKCSVGTCAGGDAFVTKLNPTGSAFVYSTFLGGDGGDAGLDIAVDSSGNAYVTGSTGASNFPTVNPLQATFLPNGSFCGGRNTFVSKINPTGSTLHYSTYLGSGEGSSIAVDSSGTAYVTGSTGGGIPLSNPVQSSIGSAFVSKLNSSGSALDFSTYFGGNTEHSRGIAVDLSGNAYITGVTRGTLPTTNSFQPVFGGGIYNLNQNEDAFVAKISTGNVVLPTPLSISAVTPNRGGNTGWVSVTIHGSGFVNGATVKLVSAGQPDITATTVSISEDGTVARTRFNLTGQAPGVRKVVVNNPGGASVTFAGAFTVEAGRAPQIWVDIIGRDEFRPGRPQTYYIIYGNSGNTDAHGVPITIRGIPRDALIALGFEIVPPPQLDGELPIDYTQVPAIIDTDTDKVLPLYIPAIGVGESGSFQFRLNNPSASNYELEAYASPPQHVPDTNEPAPVEADLSCFNAILGTGLNAAGIFSPVSPRCILSAGKTVAGAIDLAYRASTNSSTDNVKSGTQVMVGITTSAYSCATDSLLPHRKALAVAQTALSLSKIPGSCDLGTRVKKLVRVFNSMDPNDKVGSLGVGAERYISGEEPLRYSIYFENKPEANAPAQDVVITDQLDTSKLDFDTFSLGPISFGINNLVVPPSGLSEFTKDVDLRPANNLIVRINAKLDKTTGLLTWRFTSLDPVTMQPTEDPRAGFLPPNVIGNEGEGQVLFTVRPKDNLATGTAIRNKARIIFDTNAPIDTPDWLNTIDNSKPASQVSSLPAMQNSSSFTVKWSGTDTGSGIQSYTIFVSENGGPFNVWKQNTTETSGIFIGKADTTYAFYSVARDKTGNNENALATADATTQTPPPDTTPPSITIIAPTATNYLLGQNVSANYSCSDGGSGVASCTGQTVNGAAIDTSFVGTKTFRVTATDNAGNSTSQTITYNVVYKIIALFDQTKQHNLGSNIAVKLKIVNALGVNQSTANVALTALRIMPGNLSVQSANNSQPGNLFKFEDGMYLFNLKTESTWTSGTYQLFFSITGDPIEHSVQFRIK